VHIVTLNPGSSTLKMALYVNGKKTAQKKLDHVSDFSVGVKKICEQLADFKIDAVGCRVVHGGSFSKPAIVNETTILELEKLNELAPLHNPPAITTIASAQKLFGKKTPVVAVFDTMFHQTLPNYVTKYALPKKWLEKYPIKRYGFHGLAHEYMHQRYCKLTGQSLATIITLQLGSGCSACAIKQGRSVDTTMGFTPLEGLVMRTRSGSIDPAIIEYITRKENITVSKVIQLLNTDSGLAGLTGTNGDMRQIQSDYKKNDPNAKIAFNLFAYTVKKQIGAYMAALNTTEAVVFGGGIGEHSPITRTRILSGLSPLNITIDVDKNSDVVNKEGEISAHGSNVKVYVIPVDESCIIHKYTKQVLEIK